MVIKRIIKELNIGGHGKAFSDVDVGDGVGLQGSSKRSVGESGINLFRRKAIVRALNLT
jgi:hypothetical protein